MAEVGRQQSQPSSWVCAIAIGVKKGADSVAVALIPSTELTPLFRQPNYSGNRAQRASFRANVALAVTYLAE
jgi:hypothetical protein